MSSKKQNCLPASALDPAAEWRWVVSHILRETERHLDRLTRCVSECKAVDEAANFCRWLQFSGVLKLPHADCQRLRDKSEDVLRRVGEIYKGAKVKPTYDASDIAAINGKLDFLLTTISRAPSQTDAVVDVSEEPRTARLALPPANLSAA